MKGIFIITMVFGVYTPLFSQWIDDFSDNEFISNPEWQGNTMNFEVDGQKLKLNAPAVTGSSYLTTFSDIGLEAEWNFFVKLDFNPSSSNYLKVYLMADSANLTNVQNGYFIKIGGTPDEVSLYKVSGGSESLLIDGADDRVSLSTVEVFVRVTREENGDWNLKTKLVGEADFVSEGEVNDLDVQKSSYFGIFCKYTSTRSTKFYLDDISVTGNPYVDPDPPILLSISTPQSKQIKLVFNEALDTLEAINLTHYNLNNSIAPTKVTAINADTFLLEFANDLELINTLEIKTLPDLVGNELDTIVQVLFVDPVPYTYRDLVLNEIFADPNPQEDLPSFEFVELFNRSDRIINLDGWQFTDGSKIVTFPKQLIFPDSFLIICPEESKEDYKQYGETVGLDNWPALNNGGDSLTLIDKTGTIIDSLTYTLDWYNDSSKDDGGWSLEQINPNASCLGNCNWTASIEPGGGTPGKINSVFDLGLDEDSPILLEVSTPSISQVMLIFNEALDTLEARRSTHYILNKLTSPTNITTLSPDTLLLEFALHLELTNTLEINELPDLVGNTLDTLVQVYFIDPSPLSYRDVVINEIFADPNPQEDLPLFEFVELLNLSDRIVDLENWTFSDGSKNASLERHFLFPDSLVIICSEEAKEAFQLLGVTIGVSNWPALNNGGDSLKLISKSGVVIDSVSYSQNWYKNTTKDDGGWSLEQINPLSKCLGIFNWTASISVIGGSPGKTNSVYSINADFEPPQITQALVTDSLVEVWFSEPIVPNTYIGSIFPVELSSIFEVNTPLKYSSSQLVTNLSVANSYTIEIPLEDCTGNKGIAHSILTPIAHPNKGDIVINELLFNPFSSGADFVELVNTTSNYYNLKDYSIANETSYKTISDTTLLLGPNQYIGISEDILFLKNQYLAPDSSLLEADLPTMPNDEGIVILKSILDETIDSVFYSEEYHFSLISDTEGISLERISLTERSDNKDNWRSAAETVGFATPGYENSQSRAPSQEGSITVSPEVLTPNNDGQADYCQVHFALDEQSQTINIIIYNINGQLVNTLASNAIIPPEGFFTWDGTNQQGGVLPTAHYIIVSEVITSDGRTLTFRNKVVVANGF